MKCRLEFHLENWLRTFYSTFKLITALHIRNWVSFVLLNQFDSLKIKWMHGKIRNDNFMFEFTTVTMTANHNRAAVVDDFKLDGASIMRKNNDFLFIYYSCFKCWLYDIHNWQYMCAPFMISIKLTKRFVSLLSLLLVTHTNFCFPNARHTINAIIFHVHLARSPNNGAKFAFEWKFRQSKLLVRLHALAICMRLHVTFYGKSMLLLLLQNTNFVPWHIWTEAFFHVDPFGDHIISIFGATLKKNNGIWIKKKSIWILETKRIF